MTTITKALLGIIAALLVWSVVREFQYQRRGRVIEQQERSIQYGLDRARYGLVVQDLLNAEVERSNNESADRLCEIEELKASFHASTPVRPKPGSKPELRQSVRRAITAR